MQAFLFFVLLATVRMTLSRSCPDLEVLSQSGLFSPITPRKALPHLHDNFATSQLNIFTFIFRTYHNHNHGH